jgi:ER protein Pkr1
MIATNLTFGSLQILLLALFLATYSAHFVALSFLCAGLWWSVNWFAMELAKTRQIEEEAKRIRRRKTEEIGRTQEGEADDEGDDGARSGEEHGEAEGEDTEREQTPGPSGPSVPAGAPGSTIRIRGGPQKILGVMQSARDAQAAREEWAKEHPEAAQAQAGADQATTSGSSLKPESPQLVQRGGGPARSDGDRSSQAGDLSSSSMTDSEWEKVSEGER